MKNIVKSGWVIKMQKHISLGLYVLLFLATIPAIIYNGRTVINYIFCGSALLMSVAMLLLLKAMEKPAHKAFAVLAAVCSVLMGILLIGTNVLVIHIKLQLLFKLCIFVLFSLVIYHLDAFSFNEKNKE